MDFIHKQDIVTAQIGKNGRQVAAALQHRAGCANQVDAQLRGHDLCQGGLAETRIAVKKRVVQSLATFSGRIQIDAQIGTQLVLTDEILQAVRTHALINGGSGLRHGLYAFRHQAFPLARFLSAARRAPVTSRSGSSRSSFFTRGAHASRE